MLAIKLQRIGKKHQPGYRLVVAPKRSKLGGPPTEDLGFYNPLNKEADFNGERVLYWIKKGAQPTITVNNLLVKKGIIAGEKITVKIRKPEVKKVAVEIAAPKTAETMVPAEKPAEQPAEQPEEKADA